MKKYSKKYISKIIAAALLLTALPTQAVTATPPPMKPSQENGDPARL